MCGCFQRSNTLYVNAVCRSTTSPLSPCCHFSVFTVLFSGGSSKHQTDCNWSESICITVNGSSVFFRNPFSIDLLCFCSSVPKCLGSWVLTVCWVNITREVMQKAEWALEHRWDRPSNLREWEHPRRQIEQLVALAVVFLLRAWVWCSYLLEESHQNKKQIQCA